MIRTRIRHAAGKLDGMKSTPRLLLLTSVAAAALFAGGADKYFAYADAPLAGAARAPDALTPNQRAIGLPDFSDLVQRVKPAVVSIRVKQEAASRIAPENEANPFDDAPLEQFFPGDEPRGRSDKRARAAPLEAQGSGFFISKDGYIVTNNHVVDDASEVEVATDGGETLKARVIGTDKQSDLALIKVDADRDFPFVTFSKERTKIGEWVVAMGNPFGLGGTVTAGIVSAEGRDIGEGAYDNFIQIDAPINRGNSGGPTFNLNGEVIGVNTAIYSPSGGSVGIAFDIPASTVEQIVPQLQKYGRVTRGWLGVQIQPVNKEIADSLGLRKAEGALIAVLQPDSPASEAGLKSGDLITALDNDPVKDARDLAKKVAATAPGTKIALSILRDGEAQTVSLKIGQLKSQAIKHASAKDTAGEHVDKLGLALAPAQDAFGSGARGVAVVGVEPGSEAAGLGMAEGDVILTARGKQISTPSEFKDALRSAKQAGRNHALVLVKRGKNQLFLAVPVAAG